MSNRIDKEIVNRNLVASRSKVQELISNGFVECNGKIIKKSSFQVNESDEIKILENETLKYVSRGGLKLEKAINKFKIDMNNKVVMDIGSSTGGFTDCALRHGAKKVIAIDVGTDVMDKSLRLDNRIELHEKTNIKNLEHKYFENIDIITTDVSFISIKKIIDKIYQEQIKVDLICLIKPQFECGKELADKYKGIILNKSIHISIIKDIINYFKQKDFYIKALDSSPIRGGDGNIEYVSYFSNKDNGIKSINIEEIVKKAFKEQKANRKVVSKCYII